MSFRIDAGTEIGHQREHALDTVLRCPLRHRLRVLRQRMRYAYDVRRARRDHGGRRVHDDHRLLRFGGNRRHRERVRGQSESRQDVDIVARHKLLREPFGDVRRRAGRILDDELDLLSAEDVAVQFEVGLHAARRSATVIGERAGEFGDDADLHRILRDRGAARPVMAIAASAARKNRFARIMRGSSREIRRQSRRCGQRVRRCIHIECMHPK